MTDRKGWLLLFLLSIIYYCVLCIVFWKERMIHADSALYFLEILQGDYPFIGARPGGIFTQILPIMGTLTGADLPTTGVLYSLSFPILFLSITLLVYRLTNKTWVLSFFALLLILTSRETFYNPVNEMLQAVMWSGAFYCGFVAYLETKTNRLLVWSLIFLIIALLCHPFAAVIICLLAVQAMLVSAQPFKRTLRPLMVFLVIPVAYLIAKRLSGASSDDQSESGLMQKGLEQLGQSFDAANPVWHFFTHHINHYTTFYLPYITLLVGFVAYMIFLKKWLTAIVVVGGTILIILISAAVYADGESGMVLEKGILPIGIILLAALPALPAVGSKKGFSIALLGFLLISAVRYRDIGMLSAHYTKRHVYLSQLSTSAGSEKVIVWTENADMALIQIQWAIGIETLLYHAAVQNSSRTVFVCHKNDYQKAWTEQSDLFLGPQFDPEWKASELNDRFFTLPDKPYQLAAP